MKAARILMVGLLTGAFTCAAIFAQTRPGQNGSADDLAQEAPAGFQPMLPGERWSQHSLQEESARLARQYVKAEKEDEKKEIRKKLADALGKQFDAHINQQQKELADLEKQIASLRALLKKRLDAKTTIIERRLEQLVQEAEGLGWTAPASPQSGTGFWAGFSSRNSNDTTIAPRKQ